MLSAALFQAQADPGIGDPGSPARVEGNMMLSRHKTSRRPTPAPSCNHFNAPHFMGIYSQHDVKYHLPVMVGKIWKRGLATPIEEV
jgi:hypothetical protein